MLVMVMEMRDFSPLSVVWPLIELLMREIEDKQADEQNFGGLYGEE